MRFLHLGDLHLGKTLGDFDLYDDQKYILEQILGIIEEKKADAVLIAGDIYDKSLPSEAATGLLDWFLTCLVKMKVRVYMISGNHDSDERLNYGSSIFKANDIFISARFEGRLFKHTAVDEYGEIDIYLLPFVKASQVRHFYPDEKIENYNDAIRLVIEKAEIDKNRRNIIVAHQFVAGRSADPELAGSEGVGVLNVGTVEKINYDIFDDFDYVALGHIHSPQSVGREGVRYSGSILKYSLSEVQKDKSVPLITMGEKGKTETELIALKPCRDLRQIKGEMKTLLDRSNIVFPNDFMYVTLTDEDYIQDAMGIFRQYYPNTVKIDYDNSHTNELEYVDVSKLSEKKPFDELIKDFYKEVYGTDIDDDELKAIMEAAREEGVAGETD